MLLLLLRLLLKLCPGRQDYREGSRGWQDRRTLSFHLGSLGHSNPKSEAASRHSLHSLPCRWCSQMPDPLHSLHLLLWRWCSQMPDPLHSLHIILGHWCSQILVIRCCFSWFSCGRSPTAASPTCISMPGDSTLLACTKPPGKVSSDGFNVCRFLCTGFPRLLTSWALVCSLRCLFVVASVLSGPARFRIDTVLWSCALSPLNASISISVCKASCSVNAS